MISKIDKNAHLVCLAHTVTYRALSVTNYYKSSKSHRSTTLNKINCVKATFDGLAQMKSAEQIAALRGKSVEEIIG